MRITEMPRILLPCNCLMSWDESEVSLIICTKHLDNYMDSLFSITPLEFIKRVADPSGSGLTPEVATKMK